MHTENNDGFIGRAKHVISTVARKFLDTRSQKFIKAGYITTCLEVTPKGVEALQALLFSEYAEELEKQADEDIAEAEDKKSK